MTYITIGKFTIQATVLALFLAIFIGSLLYKLKEKKSIGDWYWNSFFLYIAVYKLSYILFNFTLFIDMPLSVIYFNGGFKGHILALLSIAVYLFLLSKKKKSLIRNEYIPAYLILFYLFEILLSGFKMEFMSVFLHISLLGLFFVLYFRNSDYSPIQSTQTLIVLVLFEVLILSLFDGFKMFENVVILLIGVFFILLKLIIKEE